MKYFILFSVLILITNPIFAGQNEFDVRELMTAARENDNLVNIIRYEVNKLDLQRQQVKSSYLPELNAFGKFQYQSEIPIIQLEGLPIAVEPIEAGVKDQYDLGLELRQLLFDGFQRINSRKLLAARMEEQQFRFDYRNKEIDHLILQLGYRVHNLELSVKSINTSKHRLNNSQNQVRLFYSQGFTTIVDTLEISTKKAELDLQLVALESSRQQALIQLEKLTGIDDINKVIIPDDLLKVASIDQFYNDSLQNNFDLRLLDFQKNYLLKTRDINQSAFMPTIAGFAGYHYGKPGVSFMDKEWMDYWVAGISLQYNLWSWGKDRKQNKIDNYSIRQAEEQKKQVFRAKKTTVEQLIEQYRAIEKQMVISQKILDQKRLKYNLINDQWEEGQKSTIDVLNAEEELTESELRSEKMSIDRLAVYQNILLEINHVN